ncbi:Ferric siderophore transport system, periplasmic binding protein TonB [hydrothermal vent metagenome]|uniref:Ferric siderophore transport system, periplasmic binding protein TonB n=1 Tax=hydrothermal vent metagenome TaxID=652676 RepID=A0A3B0YQ45_9ZZZZ
MITPNNVPFEAPTVDRLALTLFIAAALHALVILGIGFDAFDRDPPEPDTPTLDITIINPNKTKPPEDYDYLANATQDGAGNTEDKVQPQQQVVEQMPPPAAARKQATPDTPQVLTREISQKSVKKPEDTPPQKDTPQVSAAELVSRSREMLTLNQQINQTLQAYSEAPKSKFISARTKESNYASYMRDWVSKVERVGELNYPDAARRQSLSGKLIVQVAVYPDGSVREITIRKPSGRKILDDAAIRIVKLAAPFAPFPDDIKKEIDVLYITRTWVFTSSNRLKSR